MREFIEEAYKECTKLLSEHMEQLHLVASALLERETLSGSEFRTLMTGGTLPPLVLEAPQEQPAAPQTAETAPAEATAAEPKENGAAAPQNVTEPALDAVPEQNEENQNL